MPKKSNSVQEILSNCLIGARLLVMSVCLIMGMHARVYSLNLDNIKIYFLGSDYKNAILEGEKLIAQDSSLPHSDELYFILGLSYLKDGNYLRASDIFEIILKEFKGKKLQDEAGLCLADTYFLSRDYERACRYYQKLIENDSFAKFKPLVLYRLSQVGFKTGNTEQGKKYLDKLKQEFPLSTELMFNQDTCFIDSASSGLYYTVQVGAFSSFENAKNLTQKLLQKGYSAFSEEVKSGKKTSYRVRVGKFSTRQEALDLAGKLTQEGYPARVCP
jgi:tetratricopeptide (TPR) repeat protein